MTVVTRAHSCKTASHKRTSRSGGVRKKRQSPTLRVLKQVAPPQGIPPAVSPRLQQIIRAAGDTALPLVIKNLSPAAHHQLHHLLTHHATVPVYAGILDATQSAENLQGQIERLTQDLQRIDGQKPCALHLFWKGEPPSSSDGGLSLLLGGLGPLKADKSPGKVAVPPGLDASAQDDARTGAPAKSRKQAKTAAETTEPEAEDEPSWEGQVKDLLKTVRTTLPRAKVVLMTPHPALRDVNSLPRCEIYDGTTLGVDLDADGFSRKTRELHGRYHGSPTAGDTLATLLPRPKFEVLEAIYRQAARVAARSSTQRPPAITKDVLQEAALDISLRTEESALDADIASLIVKDPIQPQPGLPTDLRSFAHLCTHLDAVRRLDPAATPTLLLRGGKEARLGGSVQALANSAQAILFAIPPTLAAALLAEKAGALGELLTEINTYARRAHRLAVVHIAALDGIAAVADELPAFAQFTMQTQLLGELNHPPHAERQHVVLVASASSDARLPDDLVRAFDTRVTLQSPGGSEVQQLFSQQLTRGNHPHALGAASLERIGQKAAGFGIADVDATLHRAARLALHRRGDCLSEADVIAAIDERRSERGPPPAYMSMFS